MQLEVVRTSSVNSRDDWRSFSKEMTREPLGVLSRAPNSLLQAYISL